MLIPQTCEYVLLHGKKVSADMTKLRIFRREDYHGLSRWTVRITRVLEEGGKRIREKVKWPQKEGEGGETGCKIGRC